jgi:DNA-binding XRE family transcriptional regulator
MDAPRTPLQTLLPALYPGKGLVVRCVNKKCELYDRAQYAKGHISCQWCKTPFNVDIALANIEPTLPLSPPCVIGRLPSAEKKAFGKKLREVRIARNLSQRDMAKKMNIPRSYFSKIENGRCVPSLDQHAKFANAFGMTLLELIAKTWGTILDSHSSPGS